MINIVASKLQEFSLIEFRLLRTEEDRVSTKVADDPQKILFFIIYKEIFGIDL